MFDGLIDSLYKKWELYLYRLFQIAKYMENSIKFSRISGPNMSEVLDPRGCTKSIVRIPPNPFWMREDDKKIFLMVYKPLECIGEKEKALREFFLEVWERIGEVKKFIGITRNTRYIGENDSEKRLCNEIDIYMKYPEAMLPITRLVLGDNENIESLRSFQRLLKDREPVKGVKSYTNY